MSDHLQRIRIASIVEQKVQSELFRAKADRKFAAKLLEELLCLACAQADAMDAAKRSGAEWDGNERRSRESRESYQLSALKDWAASALEQDPDDIADFPRWCRRLVPLNIEIRPEAAAASMFGEQGVRSLRERYSKVANRVIDVAEHLNCFATSSLRPEEGISAAKLKIIAAIAIKDAQDSIVSAKQSKDEKPNGSTVAIDYVTLNQASALVRRSKKTLERAVNQPGSEAPRPAIEGGGGRASEWDYAVLKPWLERHYGRILPPRPPSR